MPLTLSTIIQSAIATLEGHFYISQTAAKNHITDTIRGLRLLSGRDIGKHTLHYYSYVHAVVWGQVPRFRLNIVISPLAIMLATIIIILASLYRARHLDADYVASFNTMDTLHIIAACSLGNVHTLSFPDYDKDVRVELSEIGAGSGAAGFHFSPK